MEPKYYAFQRCFEPSIISWEYDGSCLGKLNIFGFAPLYVAGGHRPSWCYSSIDSFVGRPWTTCREHSAIDTAICSLLRWHPKTWSLAILGAWNGGFLLGGVRSYWPILRSLGMICLLLFFSETFNTFSLFIPYIWMQHVSGNSSGPLDIFCMPHHECDSFGTTRNKRG